jgi:ketosteroid isomerase-like protein
MATDRESDNVRLVRDLYDAWDKGDHDATYALLDDEFEWVNPEYAVDPGIRRGHDGWTKVLENLNSSFSELRHELGELVELGDRILWHTVFHARGRDSNAKIDIPEQHLWTLRDGKILRLQWFHDLDEAERAARDSA